jgi:hypothetical protein
MVNYKIGTLLTDLEHMSHLGLKLIIALLFLNQTK